MGVKFPTPKPILPTTIPVSPSSNLLLSHHHQSRPPHLSGAGLLARPFPCGRPPFLGGAFSTSKQPAKSKMLSPKCSAVHVHEKILLIAEVAFRFSFEDLRHTRFFLQSFGNLLLTL